MAKPKRDIILIQWPDANGVDSLFPRCTTFHRLFNYLKLEYRIKNVTLPEINDQFEEKLYKQISILPQMSDGIMYYDSSRKILERILSLYHTDEEKKEVNKVLKAQNFLIHEWADEVFINSLVQSRWLYKPNRENFIKGIRWAEPVPKDMDKRVKILSDMVVSYIKKYPIGRLDRKDFLHHLWLQLASVDVILSRQKFITNDTSPTLSDFSIFMTVQGFLSPDLVESEKIKDKFINIVRWAKDIEELTAGVYTRTSL